MIRFFTLIIALTITIGAYAQTTVEVVTGAGYANEAYYSFKDGTVATSARTAWDISFPTNRFGIHVLANNGAQVELYTYPNGDISAWEALDTAGIAGWKPMHNSISYWEDGAFLQNLKTSDQFDFGWGKYNMVTHMVTGDSLFVVKTTAGNYKKLWIMNRNPNKGINAWTFKYADINGENEQEIVLEVGAYTAKNHISYSLETNQIIENEPESKNWELLFTKYYDYSIPYYVTGVLFNSARVAVQQVDGVTSATYKTYDEAQFSDTISTIGSDWKSFNLQEMEYVTDKSKVFFVKVMDETATDSTYYKMYFTGFGGSSDGKYTFAQEELGGYTSAEMDTKLAMLEVFPNPVSHQLNLVYDLHDDMRINIVDLNGKIVRQKLIVNKGFNKQTIDVNDLQPGIYSLVVQSGNATYQRKFIKI